MIILSVYTLMLFNNSKSNQASDKIIQLIANWGVFE